MGEEPSNAELGRRLDDIQRMVASLVGRDVYQSDQRGTEYRLAGLARDLDQERKDRAEGDQVLSGRLDGQAKAVAEHRMHWRSLLWTGVLPALATLTVGLLALWAAHSGGH